MAFFYLSIQHHEFYLYLHPFLELLLFTSIEGGQRTRELGPSRYSPFARVMEPLLVNFTQAAIDENHRHEQEGNTAIIGKANNSASCDSLPR